MASVSGRSVRRVITPAVVIGNGVLVNIFSRALSQQRAVDFFLGSSVLSISSRVVNEMVRSTNNSLSSTLITPATAGPSSAAPDAVISSSSSTSTPPPISQLPTPGGDELASAFSKALNESLPGIFAAFKANLASVPGAGVANTSQPAPPPPSLPGSSTPVQCLPGTAPSFISTFSAPPSASVTSPSSWSLPDRPVSAVMALSDFPPFHEMPPVDPGPSTATVSSQPPSFGHAFVVGPGYAPIPPKLVLKITSGRFIQLADLLADNIRAQEAEPHAFLDGKLVVAPQKKRVSEIGDITTWLEAFTLYSLVLCKTFPQRWHDLTLYKLLILKTAKQFPGQAWLAYDVAFRREAAASGLTDWSRMNPDLYNFHTRSASQPSRPWTPVASAPATPSYRAQVCYSWNEGRCKVQVGRCRFRHSCQACEGDHPKSSCPFVARRHQSPSRSGAGLKRPHRA